VFSALFELSLDDRRNKRVCVYLAMRVMQSHTDRLTFVLENVYVFYEVMFLELFEPVTPNTDELMDPLDRLCGKRRTVIRCVNDHLADADRRLDPEDAVRLDGRRFRVSL
jgi:hypothetical protein